MDKKLNVAIVGLGLLGGSLALALKKEGCFKVSVWARRRQALDWAEKNQAADAIFDDLPELLKSADIAVLCVPVAAAVSLLPQCAEYLPAEAVLTDIGSVKRQITDAAKKFPELRFIGSHPMAGTEHSGCEAAFAALYVNADIFLTPSADDDPEDVRKLSAMWLAAGGARVEEIDAVKHDDLVADTSHLLHLMATSLTLSILDARDAADQRKQFAGCATGFRDTTRIASSNPAMWRGIMEENTDAVLAAVERFEKRFSEMKKTLQERRFDDFETLFARGKLLRGAWLGYKRPRAARVVLCGIKHCGKSSAGKVLAELLAAKFYDSDELLCRVWNEENGKAFSVREIYRELGEDDFRRLENRCLELLAAESDPAVIALGGGALSNPYVQPETFAALGDIVWLDLPDSVAWERIIREGIPPFLAGLDDPQAEFVRRNEKRRQEFSERASRRITPADGDKPEDVALRILEVLK